ncbi:unnamed protein product [Linum tenue]|uniref:cytokinin dehydrogenase n=1 Tax=Linum tenue TaxID=586396 RepID=A0AAV0HQ38_9ROSI|nr:unnamed protein product [Linum tenue]
MAAESFTMPTYFIVLLFITRLISTLQGIKTSKPPNHHHHGRHFPAGTLRTDPTAVSAAATDYGHIVHRRPAAVLHPSSVDDIVKLVNLAYDHNVRNHNNNSTSAGLTVAARGRSHSVRGQAMAAANGVVVDMMRLRTARFDKNVNVVVSSSSKPPGPYADVGGEALWIDVLEAALRHGVAPVSWTDYLYLTVGGTLSNAGISGQTFRHGPQISNVHEMDVVTGTGKLVTCSPSTNADLFYAVLGGLGQFGIITRARIALRPAPKKVRWVRMLYSDFSAFTSDQERLITVHASRKQEHDTTAEVRNHNDGGGLDLELDYLEGSVMVDRGGPPSNWRSSFFPTSDAPRIVSLVAQHRVIYCLELAINSYTNHHHHLDTELERLLQGLSYVPGFAHSKDVSYVDFLDRVRGGELELQSRGLWEVPHPWLNLFVPKSRIAEFDSGVFKDIVLRRNVTTGPVLVYPMNRNKWDERTSAVIPAAAEAEEEEDVFYTVGFLHSSGHEGWEEVEEQNREIVEFCERSGMGVKQYLAHYATTEEWARHFGPKWTRFRHRKSEFDPMKMLSPGQRIFN